VRACERASVERATFAGPSLYGLEPSEYLKAQEHNRKQVRPDVVQLSLAKKAHVVRVRACEVCVCLGGWVGGWVDGGVCVCGGGGDAGAGAGLCGVSGANASR
jgi:hypothetical protein